MDIPPAKSDPPVCANTGSGVVAAMAPNVAARPEETPIIPNALPTRAVDCCERHAMAPMQLADAARYVTLVISGKPVSRKWQIQL